MKKLSSFIVVLALFGFITPSFAESLEAITGKRDGCDWRKLDVAEKKTSQEEEELAIKAAKKAHEKAAKTEEEQRLEENR